MRVIIAGTRTFGRDVSTERVLDAITMLTGVMSPITEVFSGGASGVDAIGEVWARERGIPVQRFTADWATGLSAGPRRNERMARAADALVCVWDGKSPGSRDMLRRARKAGLLVAEMVLR